MSTGPDQAARLAALEALLGITSALSGAVTPEHVGAAVAEHAARAQADGRLGLSERLPAA